MYLPPLFHGTPELTRELLLAHPFATVIGLQPGTTDLEVAHVPLLVELDGAESFRIGGHVARANPFARLVAAEARVTAAFHGPDAYVSAATYSSPPAEVPTWNYAVVHVRGKLRALADDALAAQLGAMAERFERREPRWQPGVLDPAFFAELRRGIVGFAIDVEHVQAKLKLSQNRSAIDRDRVETAFAAGSAREREVAALMRRTLSRS